jgi:energy-coupling factor transporter transmembrane protein EcfT
MNMSATWKFEFEWKDTPMHKMHPLAKLSLFVSLGGIVSAWMDWRYEIIVLCVALFLWYISKCPRSWIPIPLLFTIGTQWAPMFFT